MTDEPLIVRAIRHGYPEWSPPVDTGKTWLPVLCPFHGDTTKSAAVSYELDAFSCLACGVKGDWRSLLRKQHGLSRPNVERFSEGLALGGGEQIPTQSPRKPSRRVFGE